MPWWRREGPGKERELPTDDPRPLFLAWLLHCSGDTPEGGQLSKASESVRKSKEELMRVFGLAGVLPFLGLGLLGPNVTPVLAQDAGSRPEPAGAPSMADGRDLYLNACAGCHGPDGTGAHAVAVGLPIQPPDFTESRFASREPAADWAGVVTLGGPVRGFDRLMPAFGEALTRQEIDRILEYVQTLYQDKRWPRGEFNLPLALGTEKAFPEDEYYLETTVGTDDAGSVMNKFIYEKRFGSQTQIELVVPFGWQELTEESGASRVSLWRPSSLPGTSPRTSARATR